MWHIYMLKELCLVGYTNIIKEDSQFSSICTILQSKWGYCYFHLLTCIVHCVFEIVVVSKIIKCLLCFLTSYFMVKYFMFFYLLHAGLEVAANYCKSWSCWINQGYSGCCWTRGQHLCVYTILLDTLPNSHWNFLCNYFCGSLWSNFFYTIPYVVCISPSQNFVVQKMNLYMENF
jgi:hypothetical protein